jgi:hypothetical protein
LHKGVNGCFGRHWLLKKQWMVQEDLLNKGKAMTSGTEPKAIILTNLVEEQYSLTTD